MEAKLNVNFTDVCADPGDEMKTIFVPIDLSCEGSADDGLIVGRPNEPHIVVENRGGELTVHVWATKESVMNDPTASFVLERGE